MLSRGLWNTYFAAKGLHPYWSDLDRFQTIRPDEARADLSRRLLRQIRYFGSREDALPEWKEAARIEDPGDLWRVWPSLPILKKDDLRDRFHPASIQKRAGVGGQVSSTGGSTGEPTSYLHDSAMLRATTASPGPPPPPAAPAGQLPPPATPPRSEQGRPARVMPLSLRVV